MAETRPPPLVPAGTDMRAYSWFPVDAVEITRGTWWLTATDSAKGVMLTLMGEAWLQIPAASLPSDPRSLTKLAKVRSHPGRVLAEIRSEWVQCSDGRLYHPGLAKNAIHILDNAKRQRQKTAPGRAKLAEKRASVTEHTIQYRRIEDIKEKDFVLKEKSGRLPNDWQPSDADRQFAATLDLDIDRAADDFRDWWTAKPGKDGVKADWSATWRSWCRRRAEKGETLTAARTKHGSLPSWSL